MIKPEDIPDSLVGYQDGPDWISYGMDKEEFASILNDAIEAGVVSPPCWDIVHSDGFKSTTVYKTKEYAEQVCYPCVGQAWIVTHWKGQTE